jgi:predicted RNA-binding Zn-ribbon protein involved in translation (DUF1610 family)
MKQGFYTLGRVQESKRFSMPEVCPDCDERQVVPILNNKYKCKECGTYWDLVDLMKEEKK